MLTYANRLIRSDSEAFTVEEFNTDYLPAWDKAEDVAKKHNNAILRLCYFSDKDYGFLILCGTQVLDECHGIRNFGDKQSPYYTQFISRWFGGNTQTKANQK